MSKLLLYYFLNILHKNILMALKYLYYKQHNIFYTLKMNPKNTWMNSL